MSIDRKLVTAAAFKVALQSGQLHIQDKDSKTGNTHVIPTLGAASNTFTGSASVDGITIGGALNHDGSTVGFYGATPAAKETGVAVSAAAIHAVLVTYGLISA
tara:strand:+ start:124 stop:432 length:309 start_codon:yes stop_codon:yes gene_type:complete